jgi:hypothetical protein
MNRFSDLLDSNPYITVGITVRPITHNGAPDLLVEVNQQALFSGVLDRTMTITATDLDLREPLMIKLTMSNKNYSADLETAVVVESFKIDDVEFVPKHTHFFEYANDHNNTQPTNYLGFNGVWSLSIPEPFYRWLHRSTGQGWLIE